jgi:PknH-like protein
VPRPGRTPSTAEGILVNTRVIGALALSFVLAGCAGGAASGASQPPKTVPDSALDGLLLSAADVNDVMGTTAMTPHPAVTQMGDHRNLLPNLNCLGVWQVNEAPIYDPSNWKSLRQQLFRAPDTDQWDTLVVQSAVSYRTADAAREFFTQSADRWSKCTNHHVNIRLNDQPLPAWLSGDLTKSDTELSLPFTRGTGNQTRSCQRVLSVAANVILDIQACKPPQPTDVTQAAAIAGEIESKLPR